MLAFGKVGVRVSAHRTITIKVLIAGSSFTPVDGLFVVMNSEQVEGNVAGLGLFLVIFVCRASTFTWLAILFFHCKSKLYRRFLKSIRVKRLCCFNKTIFLKLLFQIPLW
jgi:hypothetical protein